MGLVETAAAWDLVADDYVTSAVPLVESFAAEELRGAAVPRGGWIVEWPAGSAIDYSPAMIARLRTRPGAPEVAAVVGGSMAASRPSLR